ncbi:MAG: zinc-binding dehydrogenase [Beutenbergiaceae bacterium]
MRSVYVASQSESDPLAGLVIGDLRPELPAGWVWVDVRAMALNHHDLWSLRGVGLPGDRLPMILGTDAAGIAPDGSQVMVHAVISSPTWRGDETLDPRRTLLSERHHGTLAQAVAVPAANLVAKPAGMSFAQAACLPTAYLTAYRMLFVTGAARPGQRVLIQGAGGGVSTAALTLARAAGLTVVVSSRSASKRAWAQRHGGHEVIEPGDRIAPVDLVIETVGAATWEHSLRSLRPGGAIVLAGATSGPMPGADLNRIFFRSLRVLGSTMGTRAELAALAAMMTSAGIDPVIADVADFDSDDAVRQAFARLASGDQIGKLVLTRDG